MGCHLGLAQILSLLNYNDGYDFTSNIVWCEEKYAISKFIAEFWNTVSNVPFILTGLFMLIYAIHIRIPLRYALVYFWVLILGVGSFLFHATLRYQAQLLDDVPMMIIAGETLYAIMAHPLAPFLEKVVWGVSIFSVIGVAVSCYVYLNSALCFQITFLLLAALLILRAIQIWSTVQYSGVGVTFQQATFLSLKLNFGGFALWLVDRLACGQLRYVRSLIGNPWISAFLQFHALWHLLAVIGLMWVVAGLILADPISHEDFYVQRKYFIFPIIIRSSAIIEDC